MTIEIKVLNLRHFLDLPLGQRKRLQKLQELVKSDDYKSLPDSVKEEIKQVLMGQRKLKMTGIQCQPRAIVADMRETVKCVDDEVSRIFHENVLTNLLYASSIV